jgi:hypothetical protein
VGLADGEFWSLTFREFDAIMQRHREREEREFWRIGQLCATIANCHRDPDKREPFSPQDFMPSGMMQAPEVSPGNTGEEWLAKIRCINANLGGIEVTNGA